MKTPRIQQVQCWFAWPALMRYEMVLSAPGSYGGQWPNLTKEKRVNHLRYLWKEATRFYPWAEVTR